MSSHQQKCEKILELNGKKTEDYICDGCHRSFKSKASLIAHFTHCKKHKSKPRIVAKIIPFDGIHCQYGCGKEAKFVLKNGVHCCSKFSTQCPVLTHKNSSSLKKFYEQNKRTSPNYDYDSLPKEVKDRMAWSRGLTKYTDERVAKIGISGSKTLKEGYASGRLKFTKSLRKKLSLLRKQFLFEHPDKHPLKLVCNNRNHMTYPEKIVYDWLIQNNFKFESQFHWIYYQKDRTKHNRYVDFAILDLKIFIEVDGKFWHKDRKDIDEAKDICAKNDGFDTLRIDPSKSIIDQLNNYFNNKFPKEE